MSRPTALLVMGGDPIHDTPEHYELLAGLLAGPAGLNLHITDGLESLTGLTRSDYDLIAMYRADRRPAAAPFAALWEAVRAGTPYLGLHGAAFTVQQVPGGAEAIGARYEEPHLRQQPLSVRIADNGHPITAGVEGFTIEDEPYRLTPLVPSAVRVLASYSDCALNRRTRHGVIAARGDWPVLYTRRLGAGRIHTNVLGHDRQALTHPAYRRLVVQAVAWLLATAGG
ncbi:MAG: ThuA domain-containing protein [Chloroflexota bacterium]|nr:ThuA domain-containing protein [Chloroflexota bacterium]